MGIRQLLKDKGFRVRAVSDALGLNKSTMGRWIETAPIDKLIEISDFTKISMNEIVDCYRVHSDPADPDLLDRN